MSRMLTQQYKTTGIWYKQGFSEDRLSVVPAYAAYGVGAESL
jgi:hypothetical protein